jgi:ADP-heptose:LPS heptosyltransferase
MSYRLANRLHIIGRALRTLLTVRRRPHEAPERILVAHRLLLGDTVLLAPLLAKLRACYPEAQLVMACAPAQVPLFANRPWGVRAIGLDLRKRKPLAALRAAGPYDLAFIPGDTRHAWLARAVGARWVVAHAGDTPGWKNWMADELRAYPPGPMAWGDICAALVDAPAELAPPIYRPGDWPAPPAHVPAPVEDALPPAPFAILHVGASTPLKHWPAARWQTLAQRLLERGITPVWSAGPGEEEVVEAIDPQQQFYSLAGRVDLPALWRLLSRAVILVAPDTGVAHLGRAVGVPTVTLFGPGSTIFCGLGSFWVGSAYHPVEIENYPCRDQNRMFRRPLTWMRRCTRAYGIEEGQCSRPTCMEAISLETVWQAVEALLPPLKDEEEEEPKQTDTGEIVRAKPAPPLPSELLPRVIREE